MKLLTFLVIVLLLNMVMLDYQWLKSSFELKEAPTTIATSPLRVTQEVVKPQEGSQQFTTSLDTNLIFDVVKEATASLTKRLDELEEAPVLNTVPKPAPAPKQSNIVREYYIPLGSSSSQAASWTEINGVEAYVAPSNYGKITSMYFEASLRIPTGNGQAHARLRNVTDSNSLFESEVWAEGTLGKLVSSGKIPVPTATKLYRVELKSSLGAEVKLENARIKLFAE